MRAQDRHQDRDEAVDVIDIPVLAVLSSTETVSALVAATTTAISPMGRLGLGRYATRFVLLGCS